MPSLNPVTEFWQLETNLCTKAKILSWKNPINPREHSPSQANLGGPFIRTEMSTPEFLSSKKLFWDLVLCQVSSLHAPERMEQRTSWLMYEELEGIQEAFRI